MKRAILLLTAGLIAPALLTTPALAQKKRAAAKSPTEVTVTNGRTSMLTYLSLSTDAGATVGQLSNQLAPGKKVSMKLTKGAPCALLVSMKLTKGAPCALVVSAVFEDESENAGGQVNVCKDRNLRFVD